MGDWIPKYRISSTQGIEWRTRRGHLCTTNIKSGTNTQAVGFFTLMSGCLSQNTPENPGNLLELFFLLEILEIWKFVKSPINLLAEFACLLLLWLTILVFQNVSVQTSGNCNCNCSPPPPLSLKLLIRWPKIWRGRWCLGHLPMCKISLWSDKGFCFQSVPRRVRRLKSESASFFFWGGGNFWRRRTQKPHATIFTMYSSNDVVSSKDVPFGGPENKILHFDSMLSKNTKFWPFLTGENFASKMP